MKFDTFENLIEGVDAMTERYIARECQQTQASFLGLDHRAGYTLYVNVDDRVIAVHNRNRGTLDYYGGFEYVEKENVTTIGNYTFYRGDECERVTKCLDHFEGKEEPDEEDDE
jgi:hypothetical protein